MLGLTLEDVLLQDGSICVFLYADPVVLLSKNSNDLQKRLDCITYLFIHLSIQFIQPSIYPRNSRWQIKEKQRIPLTNLYKSPVLSLNKNITQLITCNLSEPHCYHPNSKETTPHANNTGMIINYTYIVKKESWLNKFLYFGNFETYKINGEMLRR